MKVNSTMPTPEFQVMQLTFTIKSQRELDLLLCMFSSSAKDLSEFCNKHRPYSEIKDFTSFEVLDLKPAEVWNELSKHYI